MKFLSTALPGVVVVEPQVHRDARGFFLETWHARRYAEGGIPAIFVQDNHSRSRTRTLRGLHAQRRRPQGKLVRVVLGEIYDVAVDIRKGSPTFARWCAVRLSAADWNQLLVPKGFAHGFVTLEPDTEVIYKVTNPYSPAHDRSIRYDDPQIGIIWPIAASQFQLSDKDRNAPRLAQADVFAPTGGTGS